MTKDNQNFRMYQGEDKLLEISVLDEDGNAKDITGATITWILATSPDAAAAEVTKSTGGSGVSITNAAGGVFQVTLDGSDTTSLEGNYWHEAEVEDTSGHDNTVTTGYITIKASQIR